MNAIDFINDSSSGRRDFVGINLKHQDIFNTFLKATHPELFENDLSNLFSSQHPVIFRQINGINLVDANLSNSILFKSNFKRTNFERSSLNHCDLRFVSFANSNFRSSTLIGADLRFANFNGCDLSNADLTNTRLDFASFEGAILDNTKLDNASLFSTNLKNADLHDLDVCGADLSNSECYKTKFSNCGFYDVQFDHASFTRTYLINSFIKNASFKNSRLVSNKFIESTIENCNFTKSELTDCGFNYSKFININFENTNLLNLEFNNSQIIKPYFGKTKFDRVSISHSELINPTLERTIFINTDLSFFSTSNARHQGQSSVDYQSITKTLRSYKLSPLKLDPVPEVREFLEKTGIPSISAMYIIDSIRSLNPNQLRSLMQSTFISYGGPDENFAKKLNSDLQKNGVTTFFFPIDASFGEKLHSTMRKVDDYDRVILICSSESLNRNGVQNEIEKTLEREAKEGGESLLIPIAIDDYIFNEWSPKRTVLKQEILNRVVADFRDTQNYQSQFIRLLQCLKKSD